MRQTLQVLPFLILISLVPTFLVWIPFFLGLESVVGVPIPHGGMATVVQNYDGPLYIVIAKTFYNTELIKTQFAFDLPVEYYAAHFPLFPLFIRLGALVVGFPYSMLLVTLLFSIVSLMFFFKLTQKYLNKKNALWLTVIFSIFPARWLIVKSVGSPEPLFMAAIIASIYYFDDKRYWLAGLWGAIAQATKSPGILLFAAYSVAILLPALKHGASTSSKNIFKKLEWKAYPIILIPLTLLLIFFIHKSTFNDFFAYFHSGDNIHLFFPPFQIFNYSQPWVGTFWLEEIIFVYLFGALGVSELIKQKKYTLASFVSVFFATTIFVSHRDLMRYSLPIVPFLLIGFSNYLTRKEFKFILAFLLLPIYLFTLAYISQNHMNISHWAPLL